MMTTLRGKMMLRTLGTPLLVMVCTQVVACGGHQPQPEEPNDQRDVPAARSGPRFEVAYLDMDGTLLGSDHQIRQASASALADFQACGGRYGIATGRTLEQLRPHLDVIQPDLPLVLFNGALVVDPTAQNILHSRPLAAAHIAPILTSLTEDDRVRAVFVYFAERTMAFPPSPELESLAELLGTPIDEVCQTPEACGASGDPLKLLVITTEDQALALSESVAPSIPDGARAVVGHPSGLEIIADEVNKSAAIQGILGDLGVSLDQVVVFGDSGNDVEMLTDIPVSVAMERCHPQSCATALLRAGSNDTDTIADILRDLVMGPSCSRNPDNASAAQPTR